MRGKKGDYHGDPDDPPRPRANKQRGHGTYENDRPPIVGTVGRESGQVRLRLVHHTDQKTLEKHVYNLATYEVRQHFFATGHIMAYETLYHQVKKSDAFLALPQKVSQQTGLQVARNWQAFRKARRAWRKNPTKFLGRPGLPKYKPKQTGRFPLIYTDQAISQVALREGFIQPSGLEITFPTAHCSIRQVRIVPRQGYYVLEVVYLVEIKPNPALDPAYVAGLDIGVDALAAIAANKPGFQPVPVNGRPLKALNQFYNKRRAELQASPLTVRPPPASVVWGTSVTDASLTTYTSPAGGLLTGWGLK
jgi:transposase